MLTVNHLVTSGTFSLDGGTWDVDNNVWVLGDDAECVVIDAPHDADAILAAVGPRRLTAILCTHAHDDHFQPDEIDHRGQEVAPAGEATDEEVEDDQPAPVRRLGEEGARH